MPRGVFVGEVPREMGASRGAKAAFLDFGPRIVVSIIFILIVSFELFGPRPIGVADNNDFPKVLGRLGVWVSPKFAGDRFQYFVTEFRIDENRTWNSDLPSSEVWFAWSAKIICKTLFTRGRFDLRVLGAVHAVVAALAFWLLTNVVRRWPPLPKVGLMILMLIIFADVEYVQFFSTACT
jgi:hypothetical protein